MRKIGRNDPCPCGSGKKYKKCCMMKAKDKERQESSLHAHQDAVGKAIQWLYRHYGDEMNAWIVDVWFEGVDMDVVDSLPPEIDEMVQINAMEMLLVEDSWVRESGEEVVFMDKVLGGLLMSAEERQYLQALQQAPLRLWEVSEVSSGVGMTLTDCLDATSMHKVQERSASRQLVPWDVIGARPVQTPAGHWELSGALYHIPRQQVDAFKRLLEHEIEMAGEGSERFAISQTIASKWLHFLLDPEPFIPQLTDAATGEPMVLINEHYRVDDWEALAQRLSGVSDVEGDRKQGWTRFQVLDKDMKRSLVAINISGKKNSIELFTKSCMGADEQQTWFEKIAGDAVRHLTREISDPMSSLAQGAIQKSTTST